MTFMEIGTDHLPDDVVNREFVVAISNMTLNAEEREGRTHTWAYDAEFDENEDIQYGEEWGDLDSVNPDLLEFVGHLLQYWADRYISGAVYNRKRLAETN